MANLAEMRVRLSVRRLVIVVAGLLFVVGCATGPRTTRSPCLPPGIATDVFLWPVVATGTAGLVAVEGGGTRRIVYVLYERAERRVAVGWVSGQILFVDPEPDSAAPPWFNEGLLTGGAIRATPAAVCQWRRQTGTEA